MSSDHTLDVVRPLLGIFFQHFHVSGHRVVRCVFFLQLCGEAVPYRVKKLEPALVMMFVLTRWPWMSFKVFFI